MRSVSAIFTTPAKSSRPRRCTDLFVDRSRLLVNPEVLEEEDCVPVLVEALNLRRCDVVPLIPRNGRPEAVGEDDLLDLLRCCDSRGGVGAGLQGVQQLLHVRVAE